MNISKKSYLENKGLRCPDTDCLSENIVSHGRVQVNGGHGWLDNECLTCGLGWEEVYTLVDVCRFTDNMGKSVSAIEGGLT